MERHPGEIQSQMGPLRKARKVLFASRATRRVRASETDSREMKDPGKEETPVAGVSHSEKGDVSGIHS